MKFARFQIDDNFCTSVMGRPMGDNFAFAIIFAEILFFTVATSTSSVENGSVARANSRGERKARKQFFEIHSYSPATVKR